MSLLAMAGWVILGAVASSILLAFWEDIRGWLNNVAANYIEKKLGYNAKQNMHKALSGVDRIVDKIKNTSVIYTKKNRLDTYYDKTTIVAEQPVYKIDRKVIDEIDKKGKITQEFEYKV